VSEPQGPGASERPDAPLKEPVGAPSPADRPDRSAALEPDPLAAALGAAEERRVIAEVYITPLGTGDPSIRAYIRALRPVLEASGLRYEQTALGTIVEVPLVRILELTRTLHEATFVAHTGAQRVVTHLRIDERRGAREL